MMSRSATTTYAGRAATMRRLRRRSHAASAARTYCRTNGCTSFLELDPTTGAESCPICGYTRRPH
jgi:hypothetical protein